MATNAPYYDPKDFGCFDLGTTSLNKTFQFDWDTDVIAEAKAVVTYRGRNVKTYTVGDGITIENANRTVTISMSGTDFSAYVDCELNVNCSFFTAGDVEVVYQVKIIKSPL